MKRFAAAIYRFNSPIMDRIFRLTALNIWQIEQGVIFVLAGDLFDSRKVICRLRAFDYIYAIPAFARKLRWRSEHRPRLEQARLPRITGGTFSLDRM